MPLTRRRIRILALLWLLCATMTGAAAPLEPLAGFRIDLVTPLKNSLTIDGDMVHSANGGGAGGNVAGTLPRGFHVQLAGTVTVTSYEPTDERGRKTTELLKQFVELWKPLGGRLLNKDYREGEFGNYIFHFPGAGSSPPAYRIVWLQDNFYKVTTVDVLNEAPLVSAQSLAENIRRQGYATIRIEFATGRWELNESSVQQVGQIVELLRLNPKMKLSVQGHTDNVGRPGDNQKLSELRAQSVVKTIVNAGIDFERLRAVGFGASRPLVDNSSEDGRSRNRRVELVKF